MKYYEYEEWQFSFKSWMFFASCMVILFWFSYHGYSVQKCNDKFNKSICQPAHIKIRKKKWNCRPTPMSQRYWIVLNVNCRGSGGLSRKIRIPILPNSFPINLANCMEYLGAVPFRWIIFHIQLLCLYCDKFKYIRGFLNCSFADFEYHLI